MRKRKQKNEFNQKKTAEIFTNSASKMSVMKDLNSTNLTTITNSTMIVDPLSLSRSIRFWILLPCTIASLVGCLVLLIYFAMVRRLRQALHNHIIIVLITLDFLYLMIDPPMYLHYLRFGHFWPETESYCLIWWFASDGIHEVITSLMAWAAFERHILILNKQLVSNWRKQLIFHYMPIALILIYGIIFYGVTIFFPPCRHHFDYTLEWCSEPCLFSNSIFMTYHLVFNEITMTFFIAFFSITLIIRIIWQRKRRLRQPVQWRKHRKMTIQLLAIAANYLFFHLLDMFITLAKPFDLQSEFGIAFQSYMDFVSFFAELLLPWLCLASLYPKPWQKQSRSIGVETILNNSVQQRTGN